MRKLGFGIGFASAVGIIAMLGSYVSMESPKVSGVDLSLSSQGLDAEVCTGWLDVRRFAAVNFDVTFTDANDSVTALTMDCETSSSSATATDSGADVCSRETSSGTSTYTCPHTWSLTTGTAEHFNWEVSGIKDHWLQCCFNGTGTPAAADVITVTGSGRTN